jgi:hypothetical protein
MTDLEPEVEEAVPEGAPQYQLDLIETELERAGSDGLSKAELQAAVGLGTGDLRVALEAAVETGLVAIDGDRYRPGPAADAIGGDPDEAGDAATDLADGEVEEEPEPDEEEPGGPTPASTASEAPTEAGEPSYRARIVLDVTYAPDEPGGDEAAVRDATLIAQAAAHGVQDNWRDLAVSTAVASVDGLETRRVWP